MAQATHRLPDTPQPASRPGELVGAHDGMSLRIAVICARFNDEITLRLLDGAYEALHRLGIDGERRLVAWVPGAFELPLAAQVLAEGGESRRRRLPRRGDPRRDLPLRLRGGRVRERLAAGPARHGRPRALRRPHDREHRAGPRSLRWQAREQGRRGGRHRGRDGQSARSHAERRKGLRPVRLAGGRPTRQPSRMLRLVLPKGSLEQRHARAVLGGRPGGEADLGCRLLSQHRRPAGISDVRILRPQEIPTYVAEGLFDLGITGRDWIEETGRRRRLASASWHTRRRRRRPSGSCWPWRRTRPSRRSRTCRRVAEWRPSTCASPSASWRAGRRRRRAFLLWGDRGEGA